MKKVSGEQNKRTGKTKTTKKTDRTKTLPRTQRTPPTQPPPPTQQTQPQANKAKKYGIPTLVALAILLTISIILYLIPVSHRFSLDITSKQISMELKDHTQDKQFSITSHILLDTITISAKHIKLATTEFSITQTNEPALQKIKGDYVLETDSNKSTYYQIQNLETITIATIISCRAEKDKPVIKFEHQKRIDDKAYILHISPPAGKFLIDLATTQTRLTIHESDIKYGTKTTKTNGKTITFEGKPHKVKIEAETDENTKISIYYQESEPFDLEVDKEAFKMINLQFVEAKPESTIYREEEKPITIKGKFVTHPNIIIKGDIEEVSKLCLTPDGIYAKMQGEYKQIQIAESVIKNTLLDVVRRFSKKIPKMIRDAIK